MIKCEICEYKFKNNLGGDLTKHLREVHDMSMEDYYIIINLDGIEPKCVCGYCNERPNFYRSKFKKYAIGHSGYDWREKKYVEKFGQPKCKNINCNNDVSFKRGKPQSYCSHKCLPSQWNHDKIRENVMKTYNVDNVFQLDDVKEKSRKTLMKNYGVEKPMHSKAIIKKMRKNNLIKYNTEFPQSLTKTKEKQRLTMLKNHGVSNYSKTEKFKEIASKNMCKYNNNINLNHKIKSYKLTNLYYQSLHEYRFLKFCEDNMLLEYINNSQSFKYLNDEFGNRHLPDFRFKDDVIIEIKSTYWLIRQGGWNRLNAKKASVEASGYKYILILDENYDKFYEIINE